MSKNPFRENDPSTLLGTNNERGEQTRFRASLPARLSPHISVRGLFDMLRPRPKGSSYGDITRLTSPTNSAIGSSPIQEHVKEADAEHTTQHAIETEEESKDTLRRAAEVINNIAITPQRFYRIRPGRIANHDEAEVIHAAGAIVDSIMDTPDRISQKLSSGEGTVTASTVMKYGFERDNPHQACLVALERFVEDANGNTQVKMTFWGTPADPSQKLSAAEVIKTAQDWYSTLLFEVAFPLSIPFEPENITVDDFQPDEQMTLPQFSDLSAVREMRYLRTVFANITPENWGKEEIVLPTSLEANPTDSSYEDTEDPFIKRDSAGLFDLRELEQRVGPLTIRGHHIPILYNITYYNRDPAEKAAAETINQGEQTFVPPSEYLGPDEKTALAYEEANRDIYRWYKHAPDDTPITLTGATPDIFCNTCYFAPHCTTGRAPNGDFLTGDSDTLAEWLGRIEEQKPEFLTNGAIQVSTKQATFSDAPPREIKVVQTTIGVLKSIYFRTN